MGRLSETTKLDGTPAPSQLSSTSISLGTPRKGAALLPETKVAALPPKVAGKNTERLQLDPRKEGYLKSRDDHVSKKEWDPMENLPNKNSDPLSWGVLTSFIQPGRSTLSPTATK